MPDTFSSYHQRRTDTGRACSMRGAQETATYDQAPAAAGCAMALALLVAAIAAGLGVMLG